MELFNHPWQLFIIVAAVLVAVVALGGAMAHRSRLWEDEDRHKQVESVRDSLFILLSLLLGFTIAIALPRFDQRRQLVTDEANAIGTTMLRCQMLPQSQRDRSAELLSQYVSVRRAFFEARNDQHAINIAMVRTKALQRELWMQASEAARQSPTPIVALYIQSLNEAIDLTEKRLAALEYRVPATAWVLILFVAVCYSVVAGYSMRIRFWFTLIAMPVILAAVIALTADFDAPRSGLIVVEQHSMDRLMESAPGNADQKK